MVVGGGAASAGAPSSAIYLRLLRVRPVAALLGSVIVGRLSVGVNPLAVILFVREARGSFAIAGAVSGALALGTSLGAPLAGRLTDRLGRSVLGPLAALHAGGLVALVVLGQSSASPVILVMAALVTGAVVPPTSSVLRAAYPVLLKDHRDLLPTAYAADAVVSDVLFVLGPLLVSIVTVLMSPGDALLLSAATVIVGTTAFMAILPADVARGAPGSAVGARDRLLGALAGRPTRALIAAIVPVGVAFGILDVVLPAFARAHGHPHAAGLLLALWSAASAAGGLCYGVLRGQRAAVRVNVQLAVALPLLLAPLIAARSLPAIAPLVVLAGLPIGPLIAVRNELAGNGARPGTETEVYTWMTTSMLGGVSLGAALGGALAAGPGWRTATAASVLIAAVGAIVTVASRQWLTAAAASSETSRSV